MKKTILISLSIILMSLSGTKKIKILFFGDSITQMGINKGGYIDKIQNSLNQKGTSNNYQLIGAGIGGNKIYDLYLRIEEDVLAKKPDVVVIYEGVNDVWHKQQMGTGTDLDKYEKFYVAIIKKLQAQKIKLILATPACIGELKANANAQDEDLNKYSDVIRKLSTQYHCGLLDLRKIAQDYEEKNNAENKDRGLLTTDKVHLTETGNTLWANEMMKALGL